MERGIREWNWERGMEQFWGMILENGFGERFWGTVLGNGFGERFRETTMSLKTFFST